MNEVMKALLERRSCKKYKADPMPQELIEQVIEAGRAAPSGSNSQTTHFIVITKPSTRLGDKTEKREDHGSKGGRDY